MEKIWIVLLVVAVALVVALPVGAKKPDKPGNPNTGFKPMAWQRVFIVLMSLGLIAATSNSIRATGGGWIETEDGDRATFSVIAECEEPNASGNFTFRDGSEDVRVRGTIVACNTIAAEGEEGVLNLVATFTTSSGETGEADIALFDRQPDILQLRLLEADEVFYVEGNVLGGGNIRIDWPTD